VRRTYAVGRVSPFALVVALAGCTSNPGTANPDEGDKAASVEGSVAPVASPTRWSRP